ncbi:Rieske 2Fe-2S domain-containing protein [Zavarzinia sp.]|uniref:Rieske 2Fe-2S domain-containing protein n=1 Tax=Zavarzinia sp. TaxID=2027920 RepID=UPI003562D305
MAFEKICSLDDVWEGEMEEFTTPSGRDVLIVGLEGGQVKAFQSMCPHQEIALVEGTFENGVITCRAHLWQFDCQSGAGLNPTDCHIVEYPSKIVGEDVLVDVAGVEPSKSHT